MGTEAATRDDAGSGVGAVLLAAVAPGLPSLRRRPVQGAVLLLAGLVGPVAWLTWAVLDHGSMVKLGLDGEFLGQLVAVLAIAVIARLAAVGEVLAAAPERPGARTRNAVAFATLAAVTLPSAFAAHAAVGARADLGRAFTASVDGPIFDARADDPEPTPATAPPSTTTRPPASSTIAPSSHEEHGVPVSTSTTLPSPPPPPDSGVDPALLSDVSTILLLGGDAGPGRSGLRTDSMILVSIHRPSGRAALVSLPRDTRRILFPAGTFLGDRYPFGFEEIANAVYPLVSHRDEWRQHYEVPGLRPGAVAISQAIGYSLDVTIDDYVLIDMQGFLELVDALGGVTVDVPKAVPSPGNVPGAKHEVPEIIPAGVQHMDGTTALSYVRSRKADSDYARMRRQRQVLAALASQISVTDAVANYTRITSTLGRSIHTSLTADEFANLLALLGGETAIVESVGLSPPLVDPNRPAWDDMAKIVGRVQLALVAGEPSGY